jgi:DnaK suppressor protein
MNARMMENSRRRLSSECETLIKSIGRNRRAAVEIATEKTEDEGDLATIYSERNILNSLHESDFARLRFSQEALKALERGQYGECSKCGEDINPKRLEALPSATMCLACQEEVEAKQASARMVSAGTQEDDLQW